MKKICILLAIGFIAFGSYELGRDSVVSSSESTLDLSVANEVWQVVSQNYLRIGGVKSEDLTYGLAKGLVQSLGDQHSVFMDPVESRDFMASLNGDLEGIGAELKLQDGVVVIVNPLPDSPAEKAGIRPGDIILKVDGKHLGSVSNLTEVVMQIRGPEGTSVTLSILHEDELQPVDLTITRDSIHLAAVSWKEESFLDQSIPVIRLSSFTEEIGKEFDDALSEVIDKGFDKLVIDLRFNGGGYLEGAVDVLSSLLPADSKVVSIRNQDQEVPRNSHAKKTRYDGEIVVLVNESSASASEIVAGALQDYSRGHIVGTTTFGKGSVQEVHGFSDDSLLRITIAEWLTPHGRSIEGQGIEPDQVLDLDFQQFKEGVDNQLQAALEYLSSKSPH